MCALCALCSLGAEGYLELCKTKSLGQISANCGTNDHLKIATSKLETSMKLLEEQFSSSHCEFYVKINWIATSLRLSDALLSGGHFPRAQFICSIALKASCKGTQVIFPSCKCSLDVRKSSCTHGEFSISRELLQVFQSFRILLDNNLHCVVSGFDPVCLHVK